MDREGIMPAKSPIGTFLSEMSDFILFECVYDIICGGGISTQFNRQLTKYNQNNPDNTYSIATGSMSFLCEASRRWFNSNVAREISDR